MTLELTRQVRRNAALDRERARECLHVLGETVVAFAPQPDIEIVSFPETPAVAFEIVAEIKLGPLTRDSTLRRLRLAQFELDLLRADGSLLLAQIGTEKTCHGTEMAAGTD